MIALPSTATEIMIPDYQNNALYYTGKPAEAFVMEGEDWFALPDGRGLAWPEVQAAVEAEQNRLASVVADLSAGRATSPLTDEKRLELVLGVACHAIYHAGQVQLLKRLQAA